MPNGHYPFVFDFVEVARFLLQKFLMQTGFAFRVFRPHQLTEGGEAFVQRQIAPAFARYQIAEPMVKQFMGNGHVGVAVHHFSFASLRKGAKRYRRSIFHGSRNEILKYHLTVFLPWKGNAQLFGIE